MFVIDSLRLSAAIACVLTATLLGPGMMWAQEPTPSSAVNVHLALAPGSDFPPLAIAIELSDTHLVGSIQSLEAGSRLEGQYSGTRLDKNVVWVRFGVRVSLPTESGALSLGFIEVETQNFGCGRPTCGDGGDIILWDIVDSAAPAASTGGRGGGGGGDRDGGDIIVFDIIDSVAFPAATTSADIIMLSVTPATSREQLRCEPARTYRCNTPAPGATLQVSFPGPLSEEIGDVTLYSNERPARAIPIALNRGLPGETTATRDLRIDIGPAASTSSEPKDDDDDDPILAPTPLPEPVPQPGPSW